MHAHAPCTCTRWAVSPLLEPSTRPLQEMGRRLEAVEPAMQQHFLELQDLHEKLTVHELPKKLADLNYFGER